MSKFQSKKPFFKITYNEVDNSPPAAATAAVLGKALTGEFNELLGAVVENKGSLSAQNESGKTVLHLLIDNDKLSPDQLFNVVKRSVENGAAVDLPDANGLRPLHLAAQRQNKKVIDYLLSKGADPRSLTNTKLTALHYAVIPNKVSCKPRAEEEKQKRESIVAPPKREIKKIVDDLETYVGDRLKEDDFVRHLTHLGNMSSLNRLIPTDETDNEEANDILKRTIAASRPSDTPADVIQRMKGEVKNLRDRVYQRTLTEFTNGLNPAEFKHDPDKAWGPTHPVNEPDNRVLYNFTGIQDWYANLRRATDKNLENAIDTASNKTITMRNNITRIEGEMDKIKQVFTMFHMMNYYEWFDTEDDQIDDNVTPVAGPTTANAKLATSANRKRVLQNEHTPAGGAPTTVLAILLMRIVTSLRLNSNDTTIRPSDNNVAAYAGNHTIYPMSMIESAPIDLNNAADPFDPHNGTVDLLDTRLGGHRSISDTIRYYLESYHQYIDDYENQVDNIGTHYKNQPILNVTKYIEDAQVDLVTLAYGLFLIGTYISDMMKIITESDYAFGAREEYNEFVARIGEVFNQKSIDEQVAQSRGRGRNNNVQQVEKWSGPLDTDFTADPDYQLLTRIGSGTDYTAPAQASKNYTLLRNTRTGELRLAFLEKVFYHSPVAPRPPPPPHVGAFGAGPVYFSYYNRRTGTTSDNITPTTDDRELYLVRRGPAVGGVAPVTDIFLINPLPYIVQMYEGEVAEIFDTGLKAVGKITKNSYDFILGAQADLTNIIENYNKYHGIKAIGAFHNDARDEGVFSNPQSSVYQNVLDSFLSNNPILPVDGAEIQDMIQSKIAHNVATNVPAAARPGRLLLEDIDLFRVDMATRYFYRLEAGKDVNALVGGGPAIAYRMGVRPDHSDVAAYPNSTIHGLPNYPQIGNLGQIDSTPLTQKATTNFAILREVMGHHLQAIKYLAIAWVMQTLHNQLQNRPFNNMAAFDANYVVGGNPTEYTKYVKFIAQVNNTKPEQISLMTVGKIADDIVISTYKKLIKTAINVYMRRIVFSEVTAPNETVLTRIFGAGPGTAQISAIVSLLDDERDELTNDIIADTLREYGDRNQLMLLNSEYRKFEKNVGEQIRRMVNTESTKDIDDICYSMDEDVVNALISGGASVDAKDMDLKTPLSYAVDLQNIILIENLISRGASIDPSMYTVTYERLVREIKSSPMFNIRDIEHRVASHMVQKFDINVIPDKSIAILRMAMYLFDHQLTLIANRFPNMYNSDSHRKILSMIDLPEYNSATLPIATTDAQLINVATTGNASLDETRQNLTARIDSLRRQHLVIENQINQLNRHPAQANEQANRAQMVTELEASRDAIIADIQRLTAENARLDTDLNRTMAQSQQLAQRLSSHSIGANTLCNRRSLSITRAYKAFFDNALNIGVADESYDYITYFQIWSSYLSSLMNSQDSGLHPDYTQMMRAVQAYIIKVEDRVKQNPDQYLDLMSAIPNLYTKVLNKYGEDYFDMSMYLSDSYENYALKQIYDIMDHVFRHTISIDIINVTAGLLARSLSEDRNTFRLRVSSMFEVLNRSGFIKECLNVLPRKVIKTTCMISEGENDSDIGLSVTDIMSTTIDMIDLSEYEALDDAKIKKIKTDIVDYYSEYARAYTAEMHNMMIRQLKSLMYQSKQLEILRVLAQARQ
jgi:ankyrin repeat protein